MPNPKKAQACSDQPIYIAPKILQNSYIKAVERLDKGSFRLFKFLSMSNTIVFMSNTIVLKKPVGYPKFGIFIQPSADYWEVIYGDIQTTTIKCTKKVIIPPNLLTGRLINVSLDTLYDLNISFEIFTLLQKVHVSAMLGCWIHRRITSHTILMAWINFCRFQGYTFASDALAWSSFIWHYNRDNYPNTLDRQPKISPNSYPDIPSQKLEEFPGDLPVIDLQSLAERWLGSGAE